MSYHPTRAAFMLPTSEQILESDVDTLDTCGECLTPIEFTAACEEFHRVCQQIPCDFTTLLLHQDGGTILSIRKVVGTAVFQHDTEASEEAEEDIGEEGTGVEQEAIYGREAQRCMVEYSIIRSPTYGVPMLYLHFLSLPSNGPRGLDAVYEYLVPKPATAHLQSVGVMGGVSAANHPSTDMPSFFVHPCNTADAMREIIGKRQVSRLQYLQLWIGLIGASVGLDLPKELAIQSKNQMEM